MISLYDKQGRRELLFDNPVLQFANLAIRNAWFSGGVEWNGPLYGHSLLTCSPVFAGTVETSRGPLLRLYEFDRALETTWQVDVFLPPQRRPAVGSRQGHQPERPRRPLLLVDQHRRAADSRDTRVLAPTDYVLSHESAGNVRLAFPLLRRIRRQLPVQLPLRQVGLLPQARQPQAVVGLPGRPRPRAKPRFHADAFRPQVLHLGHQPRRQTLDGFPLRERQRRLYRDPGRRHANPASRPPAGGRQRASSGPNASVR